VKKFPGRIAFLPGPPVVFLWPRLPTSQPRELGIHLNPWAGGLWVRKRWLFWDTGGVMFSQFYFHEMGFQPGPTGFGTR